nr:heavy metal sensor histidine kinase [Aquabacterium sp. NJ1]
MAIAVTVMGFGCLIERTIEQRFAEQDAEELDVFATTLQHLLQTFMLGQPTAEVDQRLAGAIKGRHKMFYCVVDSAGHPVFATPDFKVTNVDWPKPIGERVSKDALRVWRVQGQAYRGALVLVAHPVSGKAPYQAVVATSMTFNENFLNSIHRTMWTAIPVIGLIAVLIAWLVIYTGHAPLRSISARIRSVSAERLDIQLDPERVPIELAELANSFNAMLKRVRQDFQRLQDFSADIAHELRTPITNLITQTQVLLTKARSIEEYQEVLYSDLEEYERMAKMVGDMLYLAQTDNHRIKPEFSRVNLAQEVTDLFDYFEAFAEERQVQLSLSGPATWIQGDRLMLRRALSNLLSNAILHTQANQTITVTLLEIGQYVHVEVVNPAPPIAPEHLPHLFDRFYRVDPSRQRQGEGAGLGLAIVKSIVELHDGRITVTSANGMTAIEAILPKNGSSGPR